MAGNSKKKPARGKKDKFAYLNDIDIRDTEAISQIGVRGLRQLAKRNNIQVPRTCTKRDEIIYNIHTYTEKLYGKDYNVGFESKPHVASEKLDQINDRIKENVKNHNINWEEAKKLCQMMCTNNEIRGFFGVTMDRLNAACKTEFDMEWSEFYEINSANGRISLRRQQLKLALDKEKPNVNMLIHLGKTQLGQVESKGPAKGNNVPDGALTMESLVSFMAESGLVNKDVLKDTTALEDAYAAALADNRDEQFKPVDGQNYYSTRQAQEGSDSSQPQADA